MTDTGKTDLHKALETYVGRRLGVTRDVVIKEVEDILEKLIDDGVLSIGKDDHLTGRSLEIRVYHLFRAMGFCVEYGRPRLEDMVVTPPVGANTIRPLVIEVKSDHKGGTIQRDHLRQLDDWVFDLSGEEEARKSGLGAKGVDAFAFASHGLISGRRFHPSPHKGVLVFNGPTDKPFNKRSDSTLNDDGLLFAKKRGFCILPFPRLIAAAGTISSSGSAVDFWEAIQATEGEFSPDI